MHVEYHKWWSSNLGHDMEFKIYGHWGKPVIIFPSANGRYFDYESFGMIEACRELIDSGKIKMIAIDGIDGQSWLNNAAHPADRARRHNDYDRYVVGELIPGLRNMLNYNGQFIATGCSMGGYHSANFFFRHPDVFDTLIAQSGIYRLNLCIGDYMDENVYYNTPLEYLKNMDDPWFLDHYRRNKIIVCVGQGAWEQPMLDETRELKNILDSKGVPNNIEFWGYDVNHDWPWWHKQIVYYLNGLGL